MKLALFDLDHTLIPFDSGLAWLRHQVGRARLPPEAESQYLDACRQLVAGALDIHALHRACVAPLAHLQPAELQQWVADFEQHIGARLPASRRALVQRHLDAGELCAIVTATTRLIAEPLARLFGVPALLATEAQLLQGRLTGEIDGPPCWREHKPGHVRAWLAQQGLRLEAFEESRCYSDSASDLPLLTSVTHPVAVDPDPRLLAHAQAAGWPVLRPA